MKKTAITLVATIAFASSLFAGTSSHKNSTFAGTEHQSASLGVSASKSAAKAKAADSKNAVAAALGDVKFLVNGKPKTTAKYYIFLYSASWCGPCQAEMPKISALYTKEISKNPKVELIHFSADRAEAPAKEWAKKEKVKFPVVVPGDTTAVPGKTRPSGIPFMQIVRADGTEITSGHGSKVLEYKKYISEK